MRCRPWLKPRHWIWLRITIETNLFEANRPGRALISRLEIARFNLQELTTFDSSRAKRIAYLQFRVILITH